MTRLQRLVLTIFLTPIPLTFLVGFTMLSSFISTAAVVYGVTLAHAATIGLFIFFHLEHYKILNFITCAFGGIITASVVPGAIVIFTAIINPEMDALTGGFLVGMITIPVGLIAGLSAWALWRFLPETELSKEARPEG